MNELLSFEIEKCRDPRRFPMHFRLKLDVCGIKLHKRDWACFAPAEKERLLAMPCQKPAQITAFREKLLDLIHACGSEPVELQHKLPSGDAQFPWMDKTAVPETVGRQIQSLVKDAANLARWSELSDLQRFALIKLTEPGKLKPTLREALAEFTLLPRDGRQEPTNPSR